MTPYFTMTDDANSPSFARVVEALPDLARRLDAEIARAAVVCMCSCLLDYVGDDGRPEPGHGIIVAEPARGGQHRDRCGR